MPEPDYFLRYRMHCNAWNFIMLGKFHVPVLSIVICRRSQQRCVVLRRRKTVVGGKCALRSVILVTLCVCKITGKLLRLSLCVCKITGKLLRLSLCVCKITGKLLRLSLCVCKITGKLLWLSLLNFALNCHWHWECIDVEPKFTSLD